MCAAETLPALSAAAVAARHLSLAASAIAASVLRYARAARGLCAISCWTCSCCVCFCARALQGNGRMPGAHMLDPPPACGLGQWDVKPGCAGMGGAGAGVLLCRASFRAAAGALD